MCKKREPHEPPHLCLTDAIRIKEQDPSLALIRSGKDMAILGTVCEAHRFAGPIEVFGPLSQQPEVLKKHLGKRVYLNGSTPSGQLHLTDVLKLAVGRKARGIEQTALPKLQRRLR